MIERKMTNWQIVEFADKTFRIKRTKWFFSKEWVYRIVNISHDPNSGFSRILEDSYTWAPDELGARVVSSRETMLSVKWNVATFNSYEEALNVLKLIEYPHIAIREIPLANMREGIVDDVSVERIIDMV